MIRKRGNRWVVETWDPQTETKSHVRPRDYGMQTPTTKAEARKLEALAMTTKAATSPTVREYARTWLERHPRAKASTMREHRTSINVVVKEFGNRRMHEITRGQARDFIAQHRSSHSAARAMWNDALDDEAIDRSNPFSRMGIKQGRGRKDIVPPSREQVDELARLAGVEHGLFGEVVLSAMILTAAYTGVRQAELFALEHQYIDLRAGRFRVEWQLTQDGKTRPKNGRARTVTLPDRAADAIRQLGGYAGPDYLFMTPQGRTFTKSSIRYWWDPVRRAAGEPKLAWHSLRHCSAHWLRAEGVDYDDIAIHLGHTDGGELARTTYTHRDEEMARLRIEEAMRRAS